MSMFSQVSIVSYHTAADGFLKVLAGKLIVRATNCVRKPQKFRRKSRGPLR